MTTLVVLQPNFLPWRGNFDLIHQADIYVFLDDVQYTKNDWRNRNRVLQRDGRISWLTVPVQGGLSQRILDAEIDYRQDWRRKHLALLQQNYGKSPYGAEAIGLLERAYEGRPRHLVDLTIPLTIEVSHRLGARPKFFRASELGVEGYRTERLVNLARHLGATRYLSGPAALSYMEPDRWERAGIALDYVAYPEYPAYPQIAKGYRPGLSILDLLCMVGPEAAGYIWGAPQAQAS